jgi:hypothetical protein
VSHKGNPVEHGLENLIPKFTDMIERLDRVHDELRSLNGVHLRGATPRVIINGASMKMSTSAGQLAGYALRETSGGTPAIVRLLDGFDATGDLLLPISLTGAESVRDWFLPAGISFGTGLFVQVVSGTVEGVVFMAPPVGLQ